MASTVRRPSFYNAIWRWHFYAGLFCIPFVIWLALTGSIYLWRPQIDRTRSVRGPGDPHLAQVSAID